MDAAPAPLSSSFGAFSIRRARAVVLVSYSLNAGRCHIGRRLDAAPPRRAVLRLSGFGLLLHEKDGVGDTSNERANAAHGAKEQRGGGKCSLFLLLCAFLSLPLPCLWKSARGGLCSFGRSLFVGGGRLFCVWYSLNTAAAYGLHTGRRLSLLRLSALLRGYEHTGRAMPQHGGAFSFVCCLYCLRLGAGRMVSTRGGVSYSTPRGAPIRAGLLSACLYCPRLPAPVLYLLLVSVGLHTAAASVYCIGRGVSRFVEALGRLPPAARYGAGLTM